MVSNGLLNNIMLKKINFVLICLLFATGCSSLAYNSKIQDLSWPQGPVLIAMNTVGNSDEVGFAPGLYVFSSDGKHQNRFDSASLEFLSPTEMLVANSALHYISIQKDPYLTTFTTQESNPITSLSLSPDRNWLRYQSQDRTCMAALGASTLGSCVDMQTLLGAPWSDTQQYFLEGNWLAEKSEYVIRVRDHLAHHFESAVGKNMPPQQIQNEVARFSYNPNTGQILSLNLQDSITLKDKNMFVSSKDESLTHAFDEAGDYEFISDPSSQSIGILQKSTHQSAKLTNAPYFFGDFAGFDLIHF